MLNKNGQTALLVIVMTLLFAGGATFWITRSIKNSNSLSRKVGEEKQVLMTAHAVGALLKQELLNNFYNYESGTESFAGLGVPAECGSGDESRCLDGFLAILYDPSAYPLYRSRDFQLKNFVASGLKVENLKGTVIELNNPINGFAAKLSVVELINDPFRNQLIAALKLKRAMRKGGLPVSKHVEIVIDLKRSLATPKNNLSCKICRATPGLNCCPENYRTLNYLESGTGRVVTAVFETTNGILVQSWSGGPTYPRAITVKNYPSSPTAYGFSDLCSPTYAGNRALRYVVDVATDGARNYLLTNDGQVMDDLGNRNVWPERDPKFVSIAFQDEWYFLRSDGAVFVGDIRNKSSLSEITGLRLRRAERVVMGNASTTPCNP